MILKEIKVTVSPSLAINFQAINLQKNIKACNFLLVWWQIQHFPFWAHWNSLSDWFITHMKEYFSLFHMLFIASSSSLLGSFGYYVMDKIVILDTCFYYWKLQNLNEKLRKLTKVWTFQCYLTCKWPLCFLTFFFFSDSCLWVELLSSYFLLFFFWIPSSTHDGYCTEVT